MPFVVVGASLVVLGGFMFFGRRAISSWNSRMSKRMAVQDRDPDFHPPDRDVKWAAAGGVFLMLVGAVMLVFGLTSL